MTKEKFRTYKNVFDNFTIRTLFKLISEGFFDYLESPIAVGKEANVFSAKKGKKRVMVKIYRINSCDFNKMYDYIKYDRRYVNLRGKKRKIIFAWVQREFRNLMRARSFNVSVPLPLTFKYHILVLEFIGDGDELAPRLKDKVPKRPREFLNRIIENMRKMYKARLVHADLSAFNILNYKEKPVFIDFSQATTLEHPQAEEFLLRDIRNILKFFKKLKISISEKEVLEKIKGD